MCVLVKITYLKSIHVAAAHIVINCATENVHCVANNGRRMEHSAGRHLRAGIGRGDRPYLSVQIEAVQLVGQRVVGRTTEHVEEVIVGNHCVAISTGRRRRCQPQYVFVGKATPTDTKKPSYN